MQRGAFAGAFTRSGSRNTRLVISLLFITMATVVLMTIFSAAKTFLDPDITVWETQIYTILFTGIIAPLISLFVLLRFEGLYNKVTEENEERKRVEEVLRESEEKFRALAETSPAIILIHQGGKHLYVNAATTAITGYSQNELLNMNYWEFIAPEYRDIVRDRGLSRLSGENPPLNYPVKILTKRGEEKWIEISAARMAYRGQTAIMVTAQDITERKRAEEALRLDEARLEALVEMNEMNPSSPRDIILSGLDKGVELTGSSMGFFNIITSDEKQVDVHVDSCNVMGMSGLWPRSLSIEDGGLWTSVFKSRKPLVMNDYSRSHPHKKGLPQGHEPLTRLMGVPVFERDRIVAAFMVANKASDYTEADVRQLGLLGSGIWKTYARMVAEEEMKSAKAQSELYVDLMGHDINNLHQVALGYLELAEGDMLHGDIRREYLEKPKEVLQRSAQLIDNVRKMQKLLDRSLQDQVVELREVLLDVKRELGSVPNKPIMLDLNGPDQCHVRANELLHDVFSNLVTNAIKHTGVSTDITITLDVMSEEGRLYYRVSIADNGPGVPDNLKGIIFNRALKGTNKAKGMGLGLYLVKTLVDSYGGRVWAEDRVPGDHTQGARFVVLLPAVEK